MRTGNRTRVLLPFFTGLALSVPALADDFYVPLRMVHARVVLADSSAGRVEGRLLEVRNDTLTVVRGREALDVPLREVGRFEVGSGYHRATARGALIGLVVGGGAGAAIGAASDQSEWQGLSIAAGAVLIGLLGAGAGALVGSGVVGERWDSVPPERLRVGPDGNAWIPAPPGLRVRVTAPLWRKGRFTAAVRGREGDSLAVTRKGREERIPSRLITRVETTWSKKPRGTWGALIGFAAGFGAGALIHESSKDGSTAGTGTALGLAGALVGSLVGGQVRVPRWEEVPPDTTELRPVAQSAGVPER